MQLLTPSPRAEGGHEASLEDTPAYGHGRKGHSGLTFVNLTNLGGSGIFLEQGEECLPCSWCPGPYFVLPPTSKLPSGKERRVLNSY